ncbi:class F sortase [Streptomyces sp. NPDC006627]|uniref:class F sortase n=1 Tax=Streptomyces sp. NPDC006627 TaxID=3154679 RepID=UPI0033AA4F81
MPTSPTAESCPDRPRRHSPRVALASAVTAAVGIALIACGQGGGGTVHPAPDVEMADDAAMPRTGRAAAPLKPSEPTGLRIPAAGVDTSSMLRLGLDADRELRVPPVEEAAEPGWWTGSVTPGEKGAAVIVAHYDTVNGPALMRDVARIGVGDAVEVPRADGGTARFEVREIQQVDKDDFPTHKVYGATGRPELRLVTCGGPIVGGHRSDNIILYADLVS